MLAAMHCQLQLEDIGLDVKLGYSEEERLCAQRVRVQLMFEFAVVPKVCTTDDLPDTLCYARLREDLQKFCNQRSFKLIEALGYQLYQFIKNKIIATQLESTKVVLRVAKNPPFCLIKQASFSITD